MAKNKKQEAKPMDRKMPAAMVKVRAVGWMGEAGRTYAPGEAFEVTSDRAESLGPLVEKVTA